jgi:hypothetical protein
LLATGKMAQKFTITVEPFLWKDQKEIELEKLPELNRAR